MKALDHSGDDQNWLYLNWKTEVYLNYLFNRIAWNTQNTYKNKATVEK